MRPIYKLICLVILLVSVLFIFNFIVDGNILTAEKFITEHEKDHQTITAPSEMEIIAGQFAVTMSEPIQKQANIQTVLLESVVHNNEMHAYARVLDTRSLLDWWSHYRAIRTERKIVENALQVSRQEYERLQMLRTEASNISERQLQQARLRLMNDQSNFDAALDKLDDIRNQFVQEWGDKLADKLMNEEEFRSHLFNRKSALLLVILDSDRELPDNTETILINERGNNTKLVQEAYYISPAQLPDNRFFGATYFFHTSAAGLRSGIYLDAWISDNKETSAGVLIPPEAVIWYANKPWVYIQAGKESFIRRSLDEYTVTREGWFVKQGFESGEKIVLHGAQMLLSEEFRWSIPDEDDDP